MTYLHARTHYGVVDPAALDRAAADLAARPRPPGPRRARRPLRPAHLGRRRRERAAVGVGATLPRRSSARPTDRSPSDGEPAAGTGGSAGPTARRWPARGRLAAARRSNARARTRATASSSSSTKTPTWRRTLEQAAERGCAGEPGTRRPARARRPGGCPTAASTARRSPTRSTRPSGSPSGCCAPAGSACGASTSARPAGASTAAPTPAAASSAPPAGP